MSSFSERLNLPSIEKLATRDSHHSSAVSSRNTQMGTNQKPISDELLGNGAPLDFDQILFRLHGYGANPD